MAVTVHLKDAHDFPGWRDAARALALNGIDPESVEWLADGGVNDLPEPPQGKALSVPRAFVAMAEHAIFHNAPDRFSFLYSVLKRLADGDLKIGQKTDPDIARLVQMVAEAEIPGGANFTMPDPLEGPRDAAKLCTHCHLHGPATQTVFGDGRAEAKLVFVGEQPGDQEDLQGKPFVGPAGQLLDVILGEVGIDRGETYVTNAVKHFKFEPRGVRRIHQKPDAGEVQACRWWVEKEIALIRPKLLVALGATAAYALLDRNVGIMRERGTMHTRAKDRMPVLLTYHPSFLLRIPDEEGKARERANFTSDLKQAKDWLERNAA
ncbi:MAG: UdgX family uracil-DNA binding protein [Oricola sp.]